MFSIQRTAGNRACGNRPFCFLPRLLLCAIFLGVGVMDRAGASVALSKDSVIKAIRDAVPIPIGAANLKLYTGDKVPLFQQNDQFFIVLGSTEEEGSRLCAFPRKYSRDSQTGWVSEQDGDLIVAYETRSCNGIFYLNLGETLPVLQETDRDFKVTVERHGRRALLRVPKMTQDIVLVSSSIQTPVAKAAVSGAAPVQRGVVAPPAQPPPIVKLQVPPETIPTRLAVSQKVVSTTISAGKEGSLMPPFVQWFMGFFLRSESEAGATEKTVARTTTRVAKKQVERKEPVPGATNVMVTAAAPATTKQARWYQLGAMVGGAALLVGLVTLLRRRRLAKPSKEEPTPESAAAEAHAEFAASVQASSSAASAAPVADFSGSLATMSLGALMQWLNSEIETGVLSITNVAGKPLGTMFFVRGEVLDALSADKRGVEAIHLMLRNVEGFFSFARGDHGSIEKTIDQSTMSIVLEAYRTMDEEKMATEPQPEAPRRLRKKKSSVADTAQTAA